MPFARKDEKDKTIITCEGDSVNDAFIDAGHVLFEVIAHNNKIRGDVRQEIVVQADAMEGLFRGWVQELMSRVSDMGMVYADFEVFSVQKVGAHSMVLTGAVYGEAIDERRHSINTKTKLDEVHAKCDDKTGAVSCTFTFSLV